MISPEKIAEMLAAAEKATPGWERHGNNIMATGSVDTYSGPVLGSILRAEPCFQTDDEGRAWSCSGDQSQNAAYVALCDPSTITEILSELLTLRAERDEARGDDWGLEQRSFSVANASDVPIYARDLVKELWREYCAAEAQLARQGEKGSGQ